MHSLQVVFFLKAIVVILLWSAKLMNGIVGWNLFFRKREEMPQVFSSFLNDAEAVRFPHPASVFSAAEARVSLSRRLDT